MNNAFVVEIEGPSPSRRRLRAHASRPDTIIAFCPCEGLVYVQPTDEKVQCDECGRLFQVERDIPETERTQ